MKLAILIYMILLAPGFYNIPVQEKISILKDTSAWKKIGIATLNFKTLNDEIFVLETDKYSSVKFAVTETPVDIVDLEVFYETGDKQDIKVNLSLDAPGESQVIELSGGERRLTKIAFVYKPLLEKNKKKATIELWGMKAKPTP